MSKKQLPPGSAVDHEKLEREQETGLKEEERDIAQEAAQEAQQIINAAPALPTRSILSREEVQGILTRQSTLNEVVMILLNGRNSLGTPQAFPRHEEYIQQMRYAWEQRNPEHFLQYLRKYLEHAPIFTPQTGRTERSSLLMDEVTRVIDRVGFMPVADKILSIIHAP